MEEFVKKLHKLLTEDFNCNYECSNCMLNKKFNVDFYEDKTVCDILIDVNDYMEVNDI